MSEIILTQSSLKTLKFIKSQLPFSFSNEIQLPNNDIKSPLSSEEDINEIKMDEDISTTDGEQDTLE